MKIDWHEFVNSEGPRLFRYFLARFASQVADDLVQEVLIRVVQKVRSGEYSKDLGSLSAFAFGIAHNIAREQYRHTKRSLEDPAGEDLQRMPVQSFATNPEDRVSELQEIVRLRRAISRLNVTEQEVVSLLVNADLSSPEIANLMRHQLPGRCRLWTASFISRVWRGM